MIDGKYKTWLHKLLGLERPSYLGFIDFEAIIRKINKENENEN